MAKTDITDFRTLVRSITLKIRSSTLIAHTQTENMVSHQKGFLHSPEPLTNCLNYQRNCKCDGSFQTYSNSHFILVLGPSGHSHDYFCVIPFAEVNITSIRGCLLTQEITFIWREKNYKLWRKAKLLFFSAIQWVDIGICIKTNINVCTYISAFL